MIDVEQELTEALRSYADAVTPAQPAMTDVVARARRTTTRARAGVGVAALLVAATGAGALASMADDDADFVATTDGSASSTPLGDDTSVAVATDSTPDAAPTASINTPSPSTTIVASVDEHTLLLSQTTLASGLGVEVVAVPLVDDTGSTVTIERWTGADWSAVTAIVGPDIVHQRQTAVVVEIPALDPGTYRVSLGDNAATLVDVCICRAVPGPPPRDYALTVVPAVINEITDSIDVSYTSGIEMALPNLVGVERWDEGDWHETIALSPPGQTTPLTEHRAALVALDPGAYRIVGQWPDESRLYGLFFVRQSNDPEASTTAASAPTATTAPGPLRVMPFGVSSDPLPMRIYQNDIETAPPPIAAGNVAVSYQLQLGFPTEQAGVVEPATGTTDGQLSIEVTCDAADCMSFEPRGQEILATLRLTVRGTDVALTGGEHRAEFRIRFDDDTTAEFAVNLYAEPEPRADLSPLVAASTGPPTRAQTVFGVGRFVHHSISAFDSIWFLGHNSGTVTRIDAHTGELLATISFGQTGTPPQSSNRLAATSDAVYAAGAPAIRIDPTDNTAIAITGGMRALGVIADDTTVWTAGFDGIQRVDADGITTFDLPTQRWIDLAISNGLVWAINQQEGDTHLIAFDGTTGQLRHDLTLETDDNEIAVRLVADERSVVVGTDTSGGGGRTGRLIMIDPDTGAALDGVVLDSRPEGIVLTPQHIWTSGAVLERDTLTVTEFTLGATATRGPDGSIWGTAPIPSSSTAESTAIRWAPGEYTG